VWRHSIGIFRIFVLYARHKIPWHSFFFIFFFFFKYTLLSP
jgi:hypothetical protein